MVCGIILFSSCKSSFIDEHEYKVNSELASVISKYVTCPIDSVKMLQVSSDSICKQIDNCHIELLDLHDDDINKVFDSSYQKEIPTILKLYGTYDTVTSFPTSEANAAFAWHEIATSLVAEHYEKEQVDTADVETIFKVIDEILGSYAAGTQYEMNMAACRWVMLSDYRLISAYKALYDSCNDTSLLKSVQDSYINLLEMYRNRCEQIEGQWSDLPRELARMQMTMMDERREMIEKLHTRYLQGGVSVQEIKSELDKRPRDVEWDINNY